MTTTPSPPKNIDPDAWAAIGAKRSQGAWHIPERDAGGEVIGTAIRPDHGKKHMKRGSKRGLTMAWPLGAYAGTSANDPLLVVEGQTDTATGIMRGFTTIGRPSATGGAAHLCPIAEGRHVVIVGENDDAGRRGAEKLAGQLAALAASVKIIYPPDGVKDLNEWATAGTAPADREEIMSVIDSVQPIDPADNADDAAHAGDGNADDCSKSGRRSQADLAVGAVMASGVELFHDPSTDEGYARIAVGDHVETWPIRSKAFRRWIGRLFYEQFGKAMNGQSATDALNVLTGKATFEGAAHRVAVRLAEHDGAIYLDLCDPEWRVVEVTAAGWRIVPAAEAPVRFVRRRGALALSEPVSGGSVDELRPLVNLAGDDEWTLYVAWLVAALRPTGPYTVLVVNGEHGSAKSTLCRYGRALIDPNAAPLRRPPRDERDLMIAATNGWVVAFDNLSGIAPRLSDPICCLATGGGFATRELYSDDEEKLLAAQRPVMVNGIDDLTGRPDLADRAIHLMLPTIRADRRRDETELNARFAEVRPRVLGALLNAVAAGLANVDDVQLAEKPRMADFALWVTAAEPALGWERDRFIDAYHRNRASANDVAIERSAVGRAVSGLMQRRRQWSSTACELLAELEARHSDERTRRSEDWPKTAKKLASELRRLSPNLRAGGIDIAFHPPQGRSKRRIIEIEQAGAERSARSARSANTDESVESAPGRGPSGPAGGSNGPRNGPHEIGPDEAPAAIADRADLADGRDPFQS